MAFPVFPYRPQAGALTPEQIAQLQAGGGDPYADGWAPFAPRSAALDTIGQGLAGLGAGLLSGRNWGEGLSRGLLAANQGMQQAGQDARRDYYVDQQGRYMQRKMAQEDRASVRQDAADQRKAAAIADLSANPPAGVDPQQWQAMVAADPEGMAGAWGKSLFDKAEAPKTVGGLMWNGSQYVPIPGYTEQASRIAAAGRAPAAPAQPAPKTIDERDDYVLRTGDPSSVEYAQAYYRQYMTPKTIMTDQGLRPIMAPVPPGIRPPAGMAPQGQGGAPAAGGSGPTLGNALPGTAPNATSPGMAAERAKKMTGLANVESALKAYEGELKTGGTSIAGAFDIPTAANSRVGTAYQSLLVELKNLYELGALSGPDYGIMLKSLLDPNSRSGVMAGVPAIQGQLDLIRSKLASARANIEQNYGPQAGGSAGAPSPAPQQSAPPPAGKVEYRFENGVLVPVTPGGNPTVGRW